MVDVNMKALLESGVHFGHRTHRWNPHMKPYIFTERNGIHIIDLQQTVKSLEEAYNLVRDMVADGAIVLFVGTKRQAQETIELEAQRCDMPHVTVRWLGGMLTNWSTMRSRINELERLERMRERGDFELLTKKEGLSLQRLIDKLEERFGGIRHMPRLPDLLFVVDVRREETAVKEANILDIPVLALVDTNCDPRNIDHIIPSNDDAIRAIKLMVRHVADAVIEGRDMRKEEEVEEEPAAVAEVAEAAEGMSDEELLGEATLAKMSAAQAEAQAVAEAQAEEAEAQEKAAEGAEESEESEKEEGVEEEEAVDEAEAEAKKAKTSAKKRKATKKDEGVEEEASRDETKGEAKKAEPSAKKRKTAKKDEGVAEEKGSDEAKVEAKKAKAGAKKRKAAKKDEGDGDEEAED